MLLLDFINVGYGDSILVRELHGTAAIYTMLIDCGDTEDAAHYERGRIRTCDYLQSVGVRELDTVVITHLHKDHVGGLAQVAANFPIRRVVSNYFPPEGAHKTASPEADGRSGSKALVQAATVFSEALGQMKRSDTEFVLLCDGTGTMHLTDALTLDFTQGWKDRSGFQKEVLDALYLDTKASGQALETLDGLINNLSIVSLLRYGVHRILLPGDVYLSFWKDRPIPQNCNIMKLPHHGHRDAFSRELFQKVDPHYVITCVSNERTDDCPSRALSEAAHGRNLLFTDAVRFGKEAHVPPRVALHLELPPQEAPHISII